MSLWVSGICFAEGYAPLCKETDAAHWPQKKGFNVKDPVWVKNVILQFQYWNNFKCKQEICNQPFPCQTQQPRICSPPTTGHTQLQTRSQPPSAPWPCDHRHRKWSADLLWAVQSHSYKSHETYQTTLLHAQGMPGGTGHTDQAETAVIL